MNMKQSVIFISLFILFSNSLLGKSEQIFPEKPITIVITSYNNAPWVKQNLDSVFCQEYENFNVIYVDDCSGDGTADLVEDYLKEHNLEHKVILIRNEQRCGKLFNIYNVYHSIADWNIIAQLDGDDRLAHTYVLKKLNEQYSTTDAWFVYSNHQFSNGAVIHDKFPSDETIKNNDFRKCNSAFIHLRTFYAWLFKLIKVQDLLIESIKGYESIFYPQCNDGAIIYPMLEMAQYHIGFIPEVLYIQNLNNPLSGFRSCRNLQITCTQEIRLERQPSAPVGQPITHRLAPLTDAKADCIIFSQNNPHGLEQTLKSFEQHIKGLGTIYVLYESSVDTKKVYQAVQNNYTNVLFFDFSLEVSEANKADVWDALEKFFEEYIVFANDKYVLTHPVDYAKCIHLLEKTGAYGFYLSLDNNLFYDSEKNEMVRAQVIEDGFCAWKFLCSKNLHKKLNNTAMTLYRKKDIFKELNFSKNDTLATMKYRWQNAYVDTRMAGLFFESTHVEKILN